MKKRLDLICGIAFGIFCIALAITLVYSYFGRQSIYQYEDTFWYEVEQGDTLWQIAADNSCSKCHDIREVINEIRAINACDANLQVGQKLAIPYYVTENGEHHNG